MIYGNKVDIAYGTANDEELVSVWAEHLRNYSGDDMKRALVAMASSNLEFPPTLFQFAALCGEAKNHARATANVKRITAVEPMDPRFKDTLMTFAAELQASRPDPKRWARKIVERHEAGERVGLYPLECAREALGL